MWVVPDPGFHTGGIDPLAGHQPLTGALFGENVCENERTGSCRGHALGMPTRSTNAVECMDVEPASLTFNWYLNFNYDISGFQS